MIYGYSRVSTYSQIGNTSLQAQKEELLKHGCQKIFTDVYSGAKIERAQLQNLLSEIREGDTLYITKLDRLARSIEDGLSIIKQLNNKNVKVIIDNLGTIDNTPTGKLTLSIFLAFSEFERDIIIDRLQTGRKNSKVKQGRARIGTNRTDYALSLLNEHSFTEVARMTGISTATLKRRSAEKKAEALKK